MSSSSPEVENEMTVSEREAKNFGWKTIDFGGKALKGAAMLMQDGDQQILNPFGYTSGAWTVYSFRPLDRDKDNCPQIAITPASFESIKSMETMLNNVPYVVVKEYFFKNTASMMANLFHQVIALSHEITQKPGEANANVVDKVKEYGNKLLEKAK